MKNFSILKKTFTKADYAKMDGRILKAMDGWKVETIHKGVTVEIPATWNAEIYPYKYFEVYKEAGDENDGEDENEIQCYLSCGWRGADDEVIIVLTILGYNVLNGTDKVIAEILRVTDDEVKVFKDGNLVTDFTKRRWYNKFFGKPEELHKAWWRS